MKFIHDNHGYMELTTESSNYGTHTTYTYKLNFQKTGGFRKHEFELNNVNKIYLGGDSAETYASNLYSSNFSLDNNIIVDNQLSVGGEATFNNQATFNNHVITGTIEKSEQDLMSFFTKFFTRTKECIILPQSIAMPIIKALYIRCVI